MKTRAVEVRSLPRDGESRNGDAVLVRPDGDRTLVGVIDALGHGDRAAEVAQRAIEVLEGVPLAGGAKAIMDAVHAGLRGTRGSCALVVVIGPDRLEGCSVGNIELRASGVQVPFVQTPGILGSRIHRLRVFEARASRPGRLVIYTDGMASRFRLDEFAELSTAAACHAIFDRYRRTHDDATLVVADVDA